jgi:hypothetical protein
MIVFVVRGSSRLSGVNLYPATPSIDEFASRPPRS